MYLLYIDEYCDVVLYSGFKRFLSDFGREEELVSFYDKIVEIVRQVSLWLSNISDMPSIVFNSGSLLNNNSAVALLFHTYFDIKWSLLEIAYMAANLRKYNEGARKSREKFAEILRQLQDSLCGDLLYIAVRKFPEVSVYLVFLLSSFHFDNMKLPYSFLPVNYPVQRLLLALVLGSFGSC